MGVEEQIDINASILTAGYIINTTSVIEDVVEALKIFRGLKKELKERQGTSANFSLGEDTDLIATILTAGYIVNTCVMVEDIEEILDIFKDIRNTVVQIVKKAPRTFEEQSELNIVAAIMVAGLTVNTIKWEEMILEVGVLLKVCKDGLIKK